MSSDLMRKYATLTESVWQDIQAQREKESRGISAANLADVLWRRLESRYPDIVTRYGHEVVGDAVRNTAQFHAGAEELGSSDISIMLNQIMKEVEGRMNRENIDLDKNSELNPGMNEDEVFALAEQAGIKRRYNDPNELWCYSNQLVTFANLVAHSLKDK